LSLRSVTTVAASVATAITAVSCSRDSSSPAPATAATAPFGGNVTSVPRTAPIVTVPDNAGLSAFVVNAPGYARAGSPTDNAPFDATTAVLRFHQNDADARHRLDTGLAGGYTSRLVGPSGEVVGVQLYAFGDPSQATDFAEYIEQHAMQGVANFNFSVPAVPGLVGFVIAEGSGTAGAALFVKGRYLAHIGVTSTKGDVRAPMQTLVKAQYDVLPPA
jgi:hypothetical protein